MQAAPTPNMACSKKYTGVAGAASCATARGTDVCKIGMRTELSAVHLNFNGNVEFPGTHGRRWDGKVSNFFVYAAELLTRQQPVYHLPFPSCSQSSENPASQQPHFQPAREPEAAASAQDWAQTGKKLEVVRVLVQATAWPPKLRHVCGNAICSNTEHGLQQKMD
jgi:hypothetical protein